MGSSESVKDPTNPVISWAVETFSCFTGNPVSSRFENKGASVNLPCFETL